MQRPTIEERFWAKVDRTGDCWLWAGVVQGGHPIFRYRSGPERVGIAPARFAYQLDHGPVDPSLLVLTRCGQRLCVRPGHLFTGTQADLTRWDLDRRWELFWSHVDVRGPDECWPWTAWAHPVTGHGQTSWYGRFARAHALALMHHQGISERASSHACHHCDNPPCCNPRHIYWGDAQTNADDREQRGRSNPRRGVDNAGAKFTAEQVREIRRRHAEGESYPSLGRAFGMHPQNIGRICRGEGYQNVS